MAASKILGLDEGQMVSSMGIAGTQAAGSMEFLADGAWTKQGRDLSGFEEEYLFIDKRF